MQQLQPGTLLQGGKYRIERVLGQGGFGITYLATQTSLMRKVAIKELFIGSSGQAINGRRGNMVIVTNSANKTSFAQQVQKFKKEAIRLANLNHPNLVKVHDCFEENGTVYYVMDYIEGESLRTKLNRQGPLPEAMVLQYLRQLILALEVAHKQSIWHLDIKPANIMVDKNDHVYLIDFGASKHIEQSGTLTTSLALAYTPGFCPPELSDLVYESQDDGLLEALREIGPWTDIYSLGATMYNLLTERIPPSSKRIERNGSGVFLFPNSVSSSTTDLIIRMMKPRREERPQSVDKILPNLPVADAKQKRNQPKQESEDSVLSVENTPSEVQKNQIIQNLLNNMVYVEGGSFMMGATSEQGRDPEDIETPAHQVTLSSFYIGRYEVTQEEWQAVMGINPSCFKGAKRPVECVSWDDCQAFIRKLNKMTGRRFCLPTEAEWEYAARGGNRSRGYKYAGSNDPNAVAWCDGNSGIQQHEVGGKQPNELGLYDMSGNVYEWCQDWFGIYGTSAQTNPIGPSSGLRRVNRGGVVGCRVSSRDFAHPSSRSSCIIGLRLALKATDAKQKQNQPKQNSEETVLSGKDTLSPVQKNQIIQNLLNNMAYVEGGSFMMGATSEQGSDAYNDEKPVHQVTLSSFYIGRFEVTQEEWEAVRGDNPSFCKGARLPVENVSWEDCQYFIRELNNMTGRRFRLPTEAEWEYAARGGNRSMGYKYSGSNDIGQVAWYYDNCSDGTHEVGTKVPNELGLYDMSGNVWEWCQNWYGAFSSSAQMNPLGPSSGSYRVRRGGCWSGNAGNCRVSSRSYYVPSYRYHFSGLRLAL